MTRAASLLLIFLMVTLLLPGCWSEIKATRTVSQNVAHVDDSAVEIRSRNGAVEVVGDSSVSEVVVTAQLKCTGNTQAEADQRVADASLEIAREADGTLLIRPHFPGGASRSGDGAAITVRLPDAHGIRIDTSNGPVTVSSLKGHLVVDTSNGAIEVTNHRGSIEADTSNGSVSALDVDGPVAIDTSNGSITVSLAADGTGPLHLDTSNQSIAVTVGPAFAGNVTMDTSNGRLTVDDKAGTVTSKSLNRSHGVVQIGEGGEPSVIDTSNGSIRLTIEKG